MGGLVKEINKNIFFCYCVLHQPVAHVIFMIFRELETKTLHMCVCSTMTRLLRHTSRMPKFSVRSDSEYVK